MKLLHTSDWHLGKWLDNHSRLDEQRAVMQELCDIADHQQVDAVLVAGDVFDTYNPPIEAVELLYKTLKSLSNNGKRPVIVIAGNHDSPERLEAPDPLARMNGIIFVGFPHTQIQTFSTDDCFTVSRSDAGFMEIQLPTGELLRVLSGAFANELRLKTYLGDQQEGDLLHAFWSRLADQYCDSQGVNILLGHLLMFGNDVPLASEQDDERSIEHISARIGQQSIPSQIQYTALGHLHRHHTIAQTAQQTIVYSGSPLAYSFSEAGQHKYAVIVEVQAGKQAQTTAIRLSAGRLLIRKTCQNLEEALQWLPQYPEALVELSIKTEQFLDAQVIRSLRDLHAHIISIIPIITNNKDNAEIDTKQSQSEKTIHELFNNYFEHQTGQKPSAAILQLFDEILHQ